MKMNLLEKLDDRDKVAIVAYAGSAGLVLPSTPASQKEKIINALDQLQAGGSTAGGAGVQLAYQVAKENLITDGNNRVILCTDGDFNVGVSSTGDLKYQETKVKDTAASSAEIMTVKFRYKPPKEEKSKLIEHPLMDPGISLAETSDNFRFSAAVAGFGMMLRDSKFKGNLTYDAVIELAKGSKRKDPEGYRAEFIRLVETCSLLAK